MQWPVKRREFRNHHFDSTIWNDFRFRDDDVIIATYAKSGTTWTQQIVGQLVFQGDPDLEVAELSPWMDLRVPPKEVKLAAVEAQTHRRFLKTHLPVDALVFSPRARYLYIGRDGRDVVWSMFNHHSSANEQWYAVLNDTPGRVGPPIGPPQDNVLDYFRHWLAVDGGQWWPFWENVRSWWEIRHLPNVLLLHYEDLKNDLPGQIRRIAAFLEIDVRADRFDRIVEYCTFDWMKRHAAKAAPLGGIFWNGGAATFIHKGRNGRWRDVLSAEDVAAYEERADRELGSACARWLATGVLESTPAAA
ncbi:MAG TPA: sulfotransferase domain-containing protein [Pseudomonadales bacterium]